MKFETVMMGKLLGDLTDQEADAAGDVCTVVPRDMFCPMSGTILDTRKGILVQSFDAKGQAAQPLVLMVPAEDVIERITTSFKAKGVKGVAVKVWDIPSLAKRVKCKGMEGEPVMPTELVFE